MDEFQNFATESFATILSESRKYAVGMTLAHQYLGQVEEATLQAVFGNVGIFLAFQVGAEDAEIRELDRRWGLLSQTDRLPASTRFPVAKERRCGKHWVKQRWAT